jgi:Mg-chelatase subunit ChlD
MFPVQSRLTATHSQTRSVVRGPDRVGLVGFHDAGFVITWPTHAHDAALQKSVQRLHDQIGSLTNITAGIRTAITLLKPAPFTVLRRLWLLSDGEPNCEVGAIESVVAQARRAYINVNTIGFGDRYNEQVLRRISAGTHRGQFVSVQGLRQLVDVLVRNSGSPAGRSHNRSEMTVIAIDLSASMREPMEGRTKIAVVQEAILQLLLYKQRMFA